MPYTYLSLFTKVILLCGIFPWTAIKLEAGNKLPQTAALNAMHIAKPLVIDGSLNEVAWKKATPTTDFFILGSDQPAPTATSVRVLYDNNALYLGIRCTEPAMDKLKTTANKRDGKVWSDDSIELFITNSDMTDTFYHLLFNAAGIRTDFRQIGNGASLAWDAPWQVRIQKQKNSWTAEVALPFYIFDIHNPHETTWRINIGRNHNSSANGLISHLLPKTGYRNLAQFPYIKGLKADLKPFAIQCHDIKVQTSANGTSAKIAIAQKLTNTSEAPIAGILEGWLCDSEGKVHIAFTPIAISATANEKINLTFTVTQGGKYQYVTNIIDNHGKIRNVSSFPINIDLTPFSVNLTTPAYHDSIFAAQNIKELISEITVDLDENASKQAQLMQLLLKKEQVLAEKTVKVNGRITHLKLPLPTTLANGSYTLLTILKDGDKAIAENRKIVQKLAPVGSETRITANGRVLVNGKPIFPLGIYGYLDNKILTEKFYNDFPDMNVIHSYLHSISTIQRRLKILDDLEAHGKKLLTYPYGAHPDKHFGKPHLDEVAIKKMASVVNKIKTHPALLGYATVDEPEIHGPSVKFSTEVSAALLKLDPYHPAIILNDTISGIRKWANAGAILTPDPYILPLTSEPYAYKRLQGVAYPYDFMLECKKTGKPYWAVLQAFNYASYAPRHANTRFPTYRELRASSYISLIGGATGLLYYSYLQLWDTPHNTIGLRDLMKELRTLEDVILSPDGPQVKLAKGTKGIYVCSKKLNNELYLFMVNASPKPTSVSFMLNGAKKLHVLGEQRTITNSRGSFVDTFDSIQVHVYTTAKQLPVIKTITQTENELAAALASIDAQNSNNLAYFKHGTVIKTSKYFLQYFLNNGIIDAYNWRDSSKKIYSPGMGNLSMDNIAGIFIKIIFPEKKRFSSVEMYTRPLYGKNGTPKNYTISIKQNGSWHEIVNRRNNQKVNIIENFDVVESDTVLIRFKQQGLITINEIRIPESTK